MYSALQNFLLRQFSIYVHISNNKLYPFRIILRCLKLRKQFFVQNKRKCHRMCTVSVTGHNASVGQRRHTVLPKPNVTPTLKHQIKYSDWWPVKCFVTLALIIPVPKLVAKNKCIRLQVWQNCWNKTCIFVGTGLGLEPPPFWGGGWTRFCSQWALCNMTSLSGEAAMDYAFCTLQNVVVPPLSYMKRPAFCGCLARTGCITNWLYDKMNKWLKRHGT